MRGRTLSNAFIILDEAQNTTPTQMKMFRPDWVKTAAWLSPATSVRSTFPRYNARSTRWADLLAGIESVDFVQFTDADVVRHKLVTHRPGLCRAGRQPGSGSGPIRATMTERSTGPLAASAAPARVSVLCEVPAWRRAFQTSRLSAVGGTKHFDRSGETPPSGGYELSWFSPMMRSSRN